MSGLVHFKKCGSVLVTGASRGLGLQMVETLASGDFSPGKIFATARKPAAAEKLQQLAQRYPNIHIITLDVVSEGSIKKAVDEVGKLAQEEGLNCLINNAAINVPAELPTVTAEKLMENFHTNTVAPLMISQAFLPLLQRAASRGGAGGPGGMSIQRAAIINISSMVGSMELNWGDVGKLSAPYYPYRISKAGLNMLTRGMAVDLQSDGILCMVLHPGWVRTDMGGPEGQLTSEESSDGVLSVIGGLTEKDHGSFLDWTGQTVPW
ncbi:C-signal-like [Nelusetta ayraudi]|uniref:C-signal-like n=1 Tax=Nelusetta ayraudi TaxID=303726 RepID=UPI003F712DC3